MKMARSYKIVLMIFAVALALMLALGSTAMFSAKAEFISSPNPADYFTATGSMEFANDNVVFDVDSGTSSFTFKNKLAIDNFELGLMFDEKISNVQVELTYDSFYVNGNEDAEGNFDTSIVNTFDVGTEKTVKISVENNVVKVNGQAKVVQDGDKEKFDEYYKIRVVDRAIAKVSVKATLAGEEKSTIELDYVNQEVGNNEYKQDFVISSTKHLETAKPVVTVSAPIFVQTAQGKYEKIAYSTEEYYSLSYNVYSVLGNVKTTNLYPAQYADEEGNVDTNVNIPQNEKGENRDRIHFINDGNDGVVKFNVCGKEDGKEVVYTTYEVKVITKVNADSDKNNVPVYVDAKTNQQALKAFRAALKKLYYVEDGVESKYVALGTEIELPSFEDLVIDDRTPYEKLTYSLHLVSTTENTDSSLSFKLDTLGEYYFYVVFGDVDGKKMDTEDFIVKNDDGVPEKFGKYGSDKADNDKYVFYFAIEEDAKPTVVAAKAQGNGYKDTKYTASKFEISAANSTITYTLWYNSDPTATVDSEGWVEIKKYTDVDEDYSENGYTYEILKSINYDGELVFKPNKAGSYKIVCKAVSKVSYNVAEDSALIRIKEEGKVVVPDDHWLENNAWSVVFLSIGSLCLIGIVVLLFIKPKDTEDTKKK